MRRNPTLCSQKEDSSCFIPAMAFTWVKGRLGTHPSLLVDLSSTMSEVRKREQEAYLEFQSSVQTPCFLLVSTDHLSSWGHSIRNDTCMGPTTCSLFFPLMHLTAACQLSLWLSSDEAPREHSVREASALRNHHSQSPRCRSELKHICLRFPIYFFKLSAAFHAKYRKERQLLNTKNKHMNRR